MISVRSHTPEAGVNAEQFFGDAECPDIIDTADDAAGGLSQLGLRGVWKTSRSEGDGGSMLHGTRAVVKSDTAASR